jgi:hypothetical protein
VLVLTNDICNQGEPNERVPNLLACYVADNDAEAWRKLSLSTDGNYSDANADALLAQIR